ncbi:MAG: phosphoribosylformylglycinamidine synthase subunit PurS, partial [Candidatus Omnitrophica bacterium]|nr:phosphoribosylformylglycinamidine synthase subunit PurS [Candidatus Omnitrophota bacterium]
MQYKIEVVDKPGIFDAVGQGIRKDILDLGINSVKEVKFIQVYTLEGNLSENQVVKICDELLTDKVSQEYRIMPWHPALADRPVRTSVQHIVEVAYNPGVMDPVEASALKGIQDLGILGVESVKTAKKYILYGKLSSSQIKTISEKLLYNKLIQHIVNPAAIQADTRHQPGYRFNLITVDLLNATGAGLLEISKKGQLFLNLDEMQHIQDYFRKQKRNPVDCELETIAQTWSEHCYHKTFRGNIAYKENKAAPALGNKSIKGLLKSTIMKVTKELNKGWCVSVFKDNAGVIKFDEKNNICFKVETHNHPSALEPFGGANTGIGGVIRDPMGTGMG